MNLIVHGYTLNELIHKSDRSLIYLATHIDSGRRVIIKTSQHELPNLDDLTRIHNEFEIGSQLYSSRTELENSMGHPVIVRDYFPGKSIKEIIAEQELDLSKALNLSIKIAKKLELLHQKKIIHKDLNPNNIIYNAEDDTIQLIDFEFSSLIEFKPGSIINTQHLEGTLQYIAPEQTGRMNRSIDHRSDLYSLGITMYEMFSGQLPFDTEDPIELVHSHIAKHPRPVDKYNPAIPLAISNIIQKLLEKNAENRYQTASGLLADLVFCQKEWATTQRIENFVLGRYDHIDRLQIQQKLYGREEQLTTLLSTYKSASEGSLEFLLVSGYSGVGKTSLVNEIFKPITEKRGIFIAGKFDKLQRNTPYFAWIQAFKQFVDQLLTENEASQIIWSHKIQHSLGHSGKLLTDLIPSLELLIGKQNELVHLAPRDAQNRFSYVLRSFINTICGPQNPLVIFLDDLQWADADSLQLLHNTLTDNATKYLMVIGSYRDNEVNEHHPLITTLKSVETELGYNPAHHIELGNLKNEDVLSLICDTFATTIAASNELSKLVFEKTGGNAFFVNEFLKSLNNEKLIDYNYSSNQWVWNIEQIKQTNITDNVVQLLTDRIKKLDPSVISILQAASCIGNRFDLQTLDSISGKTPQETARLLWESVKEGITQPEDVEYKYLSELPNESPEKYFFRFSHDRIQQAVYSLIPAEQNSKIHLRVAQLFIERLNQEEKENRIFDITNHLNAGIIDKPTPDLSLQLIEYNTSAGFKARKSAAYSTAFSYFSTALKLLPPTCWAKQFDATLGLFNNTAEAAYLSGNTLEAIKLTDEIIKNCTEITDTIQAYEIRITIYSNQIKHQDVIRETLEILKKLGVSFPSTATKGTIIKEFIFTKIAQKGRKPSEIENLHSMQNPKMEAAMRIFSSASASFFLSDPNLYAVSIFRMVQISLKYGLTKYASIAFGTYGLVLCSAMGDVENGYHFGLLGKRIVEKYKATDLYAILNFIYYFFIHYWQNPAEDSIDKTFAAYQEGMERGSPEYASYCLIAYVNYKEFLKFSLKDLTKEIETGIKIARQYKQEIHISFLESNWDRINCLKTHTDPKAPFVFVNTTPEVLKEKFSGNDKTYQFTHFQSLVYLHASYDHPQEFIQCVFESRKYIDAIKGTYTHVTYLTYEIAGIVRFYSDLNPTDKKKALTYLKENLNLFKKWSSLNPYEFAYRYDFAQAGIHVISKNFKKADAYYQSTISKITPTQRASEMNLILSNAIAFYQSQNQIAKTENLMHQQLNVVGQWGATGLLAYLTEKYRHLIKSELLGSNVAERKGISQSISQNRSNSGVIGGLDSLTIFKSTEALSSEIKLNRLLEKLMHIAIENAGAQSGFFILEKNQQLYIAARSHAQGTTQYIEHHLPLAGTHLVPEIIINYVAKTKESLLIDDLPLNQLFNTDPLVLRSKIRSVLCVPFIHQGKLSGIIFLSNQLVPGAFTEDRMALLKLLAGQIAVSIENALLYENLERKVKERTQQLELEKQKTDELLLNILPPNVADELKQTGTSTPRRFENISIMFTDFHSFTKLAEELAHEELVKELDEFFRKFDEITSKHGLEKIKTVGDAYMCAGGLPGGKGESIVEIIKAAIEIRDFVDQRNKEKRVENKPEWEIRIGINTGTVVAGIVGNIKFAYDLWGDAVNIASRMESSSEIGRINVTGKTYELAKSHFHFEYRGKISVKNKGEIDMYYVANEK